MAPSHSGADKLQVVETRALSIEGAFEFTPVVHVDDRGAFAEHFRHEPLEEAIGHAFVLRQANTSVSRRGTVRGIHYAAVPPGQAKYVSAQRGAFLDYVVDLRVGSPTFARWDTVRLDDVERRAVYLSEGLGHVLVALSDDATATYFVSEVYDPTGEFTISPLDPDIGLVFPDEVAPAVMSPRDTAAPSLAEARERGLLPDYETCRRYIASLAPTAVGSDGGSDHGRVAR